MPIYEPGLEEMVRRNVECKRLKFTTNLTDVLDDVEVVFSAVGTPPDEDGSADLKYVLAVAKEFGQHINKYTILVTKSTVPVGTAKKVKTAIQEELDKRGVDVSFDVASNPEFLKEGAAIKDFMSPDCVVVGTESDKAKEVLTRLYRPLMLQNFRVIFMDIPSAEMTKYAANAMLATRISFMNDIANLCERVGANVDSVRKDIGCRLVLVANSSMQVAAMVVPASPRMSRPWFIPVWITTTTWRSSRPWSVSTRSRRALFTIRLSRPQDLLRVRPLPSLASPLSPKLMICVKPQHWSSLISC